MPHPFQAPSKVFTVIPDGDVDPDSPVTTNLMSELRDNDIHLEEWLGLSFTAAQDHDHDGVNSHKVDFGDLLNAPVFALEKAIFDIVIDSGVSVIGSTGAVGFTPLVAIVNGIVSNISGSSDGHYSGFATGVGTAAKAVGHHVSGAGNNSGVSVDSDSIGGVATNIGGISTSFLRDLDVTNFDSSEIEFTVSAASSGVWTFFVLVLG